MKVKNILFILIVLFAFVACNEDKDPVFEYPTTPNVLNNPNVGTLELLEDNKADDALTLSWAKGEQPNIKVVLQYAIQFDIKGNNFANAQTLGETADLTYTVTVETLNDFLTKNLSQEAFTEVEYDIRIMSMIKGKETSLALPETASNSYSIAITTYDQKAMYMIGADFGNWDWASDGVVEMVPVNGQEDVYWCVRYFEANKGFKWSPKREWKGDFNSLGSNDSGFTLDEEGNAIVQTSGIYSVYIDYDKGKITIESAKVYGMGDSFGGWNEGAYPFAVNDKVMEITTIADSKELRMYATSSAAVGVEWWQMEFIILNGKIVYRGNDGDQERVTVAAGKKITLDFNAGTGTIE